LSHLTEALKRESIFSILTAPPSSQHDINMKFNTGSSINDATNIQDIDIDSDETAEVSALAHRYSSGLDTVLFSVVRLQHLLAQLILLTYDISCVVRIPLLSFAILR
jgi:hypothetical protein